jgi:hypothetical protein
MPRNVPRKNISRVISDIFHPKARVGEPEAGATPSLERGGPLTPQSVASPPVKRAALAFLAIAALAGVALAISTYRFERSRLTSVASEVGEMQTAMRDVKELDFGEARRKLLEGSANLEELFGAGASGGMSVQGLLGAFGSLFGEIGSSYAGLQDISGQALLLVSSLDVLEREWFALTTSGRGEELLQLLRDIRGQLGAVSEALTRVAAVSEKLQGISSENPAAYLDLQIIATRAKNFLDALVPWLEGEERHIAVFFYNPSEERPGGGFLGSYADVTLAKGSVAGIRVHDINESDREFERKIVPPRELQVIVKRWRAADANWFFDFSASAEKTLSFLETSKFYVAKNIRFGGAVAVLPRVVSDLLLETGPIRLSPSLVIDAENFLYEIQKEVQAGQAAQASSPKAILGELVPRVIERLAQATSSGDALGLASIAQWLGEKDAMVYFREPVLQNFAKSYDAAGAVFEPPDDFDGEYLAVVNANIGGAKTDLFMDQAITLQSQVGNDGLVSNHLAILRTHRGNEAKSWWYREPNQNYVKVFTSSGSQLKNAVGMFAKTVSPKVDYKAEGYEVDPDLKALEDTRVELASVPRVTLLRESEKTVFGTWTRTALGASTTLSLDYTRRLLAPPRDGGTYAVVLEKQAGASGKYHIEVSAPVGFRWKENGLPVFEYETDNLPGRLVLDLTFEKVAD